jgi:hypothetical protein
MSIPSITPPPPATRVAQASPASQKLDEKEIKGRIRSTLNAFIKNKSDTEVTFPAEVENGSAVIVTKKGNGFYITSYGCEPIYLENQQRYLKYQQTVINLIYNKVTSNKKNQFSKPSQPPTPKECPSKFEVYA